jgi:hypothetical protein
MENIYDWIKIALNIIFVVVIPAVIIYFRVKKKIGTGFAAGMILTSFLLSLMAVASVREDPVNKFIRLMNSGAEQQAEAKAALKQVIQLGDEEFLRIDEREIRNHQSYIVIKSELASEYLNLSEKVFNDAGPAPVYECGSIENINKNLERLNHSKRLIIFAEIAGGANAALKKDITNTIADREKKLSDLVKKCG